MTQTSDIADLADRFLRLWEDSWQQIAQDPAIARYWANLFAALQQSAFVPPAPSVATAATSRYPYEHDDAGKQTGGAAPAAAAPVDGGKRVDELTQRVRALEQSVAELAARVDGPGGGGRRSTG